MVTQYCHNVYSTISYLLDYDPTAMLKLLGKSSSINVRKVLWTLAECGQPYDQEEWGSGFQSTHTDEFLALNPNGMVPVLIDGDLVLWESNTICRYLAAKYGSPALLPEAPDARAKVEQWMDWQATELNNAWRYAFMGLVRESAAHTDQEAIAASVANWNRHMALLDRHLSRHGPYSTGAQFALSDIVLALSVNRWAMTPMERPALPAVDRLIALLSERPAFKIHCQNGVP